RQEKAVCANLQTGAGTAECETFRIVQEASWWRTRQSIHHVCHSVNERIVWIISRTSGAFGYVRRSFAQTRKLLCPLCSVKPGGTPKIGFKTPMTNYGSARATASTF